MIKKRRKLVFWNITGIGNKGVDFWQYIKKFDFISCVKLGQKGKSRKIIKERLSKTHE